MYHLQRQLHMNSGRIPYVPFYPDKASKDYQWMDIYNALGRTRTLFVGRFLDEESCNQLIASLLWLEGQSSEVSLKILDSFDVFQIYVPILPCL